MWFKQAVGLMDLCNIANPTYRLVLVQCALSEAQQEAVAHILESDTPASKAYPQLKAELTRMHQKSSWDQLPHYRHFKLCTDLYLDFKILSRSNQHEVPIFMQLFSKNVLLIPICFLIYWRFYTKNMTKIQDLMIIKYLQYRT